MKLLPGPEKGWQIRAANRRIGEIDHRKLLQHFVVAESAAAEKRAERLAGPDHR